MKNPLGVSPSKGYQGTTQGKEKNFYDLGGNRTHDLQIRSTIALPTKLRGWTEEVRDDSGGESQRRERKVTCKCHAVYVHDFLPNVFPKKYIVHYSEQTISCSFQKWNRLPETWLSSIPNIPILE